MDRLIVYYEDFENWDQTLQPVLNFLEVNETVLKPVLNKVGAKNWYTEVINYQEVEKVLVQNNYSNYLL
jgi:hypothetical protein